MLMLTVYVKIESCVQLFVTPMDCSPQNSPGQNTGVGSLSLLQGIFPTQGSNPGLPQIQLPGGFFTSWTTREDHVLKTYS